MIEDQLSYEIEVYTCRLCGYIESISSKIGIPPNQCPECSIESSFVLIDIVPNEDHIASL